MIFTSEDPVLQEFLAFAEQKTVSEPGPEELLGTFGLKGKSGPLLRTIR